MTRKDRIKALFKLAPHGTELSGFEAIEITGFWMAWTPLYELENEGFLVSRWDAAKPDRPYRRRLYRLQAAHVGAAR